MWPFLCVLWISAALFASVSDASNGHFSIIASTKNRETIRFKRFNQTVSQRGLRLNVLPSDSPVAVAPVHTKISMLRSELEPFKDNGERIVLFVDSPNVLMNHNADEVTIVKQFQQLDARIVFSADDVCWPEADLAVKWKWGNGFLDSRLFIGYAPEVYAMLLGAETRNDEDDQLFYTNTYLDEEKRQRLNIKVDHRSQLFQNLHGAESNISLQFTGKGALVRNTVHNTVPVVVYDSGPSNVLIDTLGNYIPFSWTEDGDCVTCLHDTVDLEKKKSNDLPKVTIGIFIESATPFLEEFLYKVHALNYPKDKVSLFIHIGANYHRRKRHVDRFLEAHGEAYNGVKVIRHEDGVKESEARNQAVGECVATRCDYYFSLDGAAHIDKPDTLKLLIEQNRPVVAPLLIRHHRKKPYQANYFTTLSTASPNGNNIDYYLFKDIVKGRRKGLWHVPCVNKAYLIRADVLRNRKSDWYTYKKRNVESAFCTNMRNRDVDLYVTNRHDWGHIVNVNNFQTSHLNDELYQVRFNRWDWEKRYLHPNYSQSLENDANISQPCPDVYWFPMVTDRFADELVGEMQNFGKWSDGSSHDKRCEGDYEAVPTRDIHLTEIDFEIDWLLFLRTYVQPLQERVFGHWSMVPYSFMNFVVRYKPDEQPSLKPHNDASTYTINIALNTVGVDYEGGGCHFIDHSCKVLDTRKGWLMMHPGNSFHEGLPTTKGTRYIMVSFVVPFEDYAGAEERTSTSTVRPRMFA